MSCFARLVVLCLVWRFCAAIPPVVPPYPELERMSALRDEKSDRVMTLSDMDFIQARSWPKLFDRLIKQRLPPIQKDSLANNGKYFDKIVCVGLPSSGSTAIAQSLRMMGMRFQGRWTKAFADAGGIDEWYSSPDVWKPLVSSIQKLIDNHEVFEDFPWSFLHRSFDSLNPSRQRRVGYILTVSPCREEAERCTARANHFKHGVNSENWVTSHCQRTYRRCNLHLLDVYNFISSRWSTFDDVLVLDTSNARLNAAEGGLENWKQLVEFVYGGSMAVFGLASSRNMTAKEHTLLNLKPPDSLLTHTMKAKGGTRSFCESKDFDVMQHWPVDGKLMVDIPPLPVSKFCNNPRVSKTAFCRSQLWELKKFYNGSVPKAMVPPAMRNM